MLDHQNENGTGIMHCFSRFDRDDGTTIVVCDRCYKAFVERDNVPLNVQHEECVCEVAQSHDFSVIEDRDTAGFFGMVNGVTRRVLKGYRFCSKCRHKAVFVYYDADTEETLMISWPYHLGEFETCSVVRMKKALL